MDIVTLLPQTHKINFTGTGGHLAPLVIFPGILLLDEATPTQALPLRRLDGFEWFTVRLCQNSH